MVVVEQKVITSIQTSKKETTYINCHFINVYMYGGFALNIYSICSSKGGNIAALIWQPANEPHSD